jgi:hypothetical protein
MRKQGSLRGPSPKAGANNGDEFDDEFDMLFEDVRDGGAGAGAGAAETKKNVVHKPMIQVQVRSQAQKEQAQKEQVQKEVNRKAEEERKEQVQKEVSRKAEEERKGAEEAVRGRVYTWCMLWQCSLRLSLLVAAACCRCLLPLGLACNHL